MRIHTLQKKNNFNLKKYFIRIIILYKLLYTLPKFVQNVFLKNTQKVSQPLTYSLTLD